MRSTGWQAIGTWVQVLVVEDRALEPAAALLREQLAELDRACSRFRADSELCRLRPGRQQVGPVLELTVRAALLAAEQTEGLVDPTLGCALVAAGYDRTFAEVPPDGPETPPVKGGSWQKIGCGEGTLDLPAGVLLDLGATAKAWAADRAAEAVASDLGTGVLVNLGGDLAVAGPPPDHGWPVAVGGSTVALTTGGLATSSTRLRTWRRGGRVRHHVLDPRTGTSAVTPWTEVSVAAATCLEANTASTAAVVLAEAAPQWLSDRDLPARLVADDRVVTTAGWAAA